VLKNGNFAIFSKKFLGATTQNRIFATFCFNTQAFPEPGKRFFASKMSNSDSPHVFTPRGVISRKKFSSECPPYCVVALKFQIIFDSRIWGSIFDAFFNFE
jgi:hypothetical protein